MKLIYLFVGVGLGLTVLAAVLILLMPAGVNIPTVKSDSIVNPSVTPKPNFSKWNPYINTSNKYRVLIPQDFRIDEDKLPGNKLKGSVNFYPSVGQELGSIEKFVVSVDKGNLSIKSLSTQEDFEKVYGDSANTAEGEWQKKENTVTSGQKAVILSKKNTNGSTILTWFIYKNLNYYLEMESKNLSEYDTQVYEQFISNFRLE